MRCSCQICGEYMIQDERGLESRCICPNCFHTCAACMGTVQKPATKEELIRLMSERTAIDLEADDRWDGRDDQRNIKEQGD